MTTSALTMRPLKVAGIPAQSQDLSGQWKFNPRMCAGGEAVSKEEALAWADIQAPGEWVMQGFSTTPDRPAAYFRTFALDENHAIRRWKLRFSAVYSLCQVWVNGVAVGAHEGGFVPFECDITSAIHPEENTLCLSVQSESQLDRLSCGSQYAGHPLGGITRKVQVFSVPVVHVAALKIETVFDSDFRDAVLTAHFILRNQSDLHSSGVATCSVAGISVNTTWQDVPPGIEWPMVVSLSVKNPAKWDCEHPHLYAFTLTAKDSMGEEETVEEQIGFRQVEVLGRRVFVNGTSVKLFGVCRHEVHPLLGRALTPALWELDAELFRAGNCNFIRTSHYPPAEEFLIQCDRLGLFVELEAPICWVGQATPQEPAVLQRLTQANLETVEGYLNHPSVIIRSLGNESAWSPLFAQIHTLVRQADPSRPTTFHDQCWGTANNFGSTEMSIAVNHYPGVQGPTDALQEKRPVLFGEYCHLNCYNRRELWTDPSLRDLWGAGLAAARDRMSQSEPVLGGAIWAGLDDTFFLPNGDIVGYGTWGPLDGWRRPKPEYWHMKKAYSPLRLTETCIPLPALGRPAVLNIENRHTFSDLRELQFVWKLGGATGTASVSAPPGHCGQLEIILIDAAKVGEILTIEAHSPRGFMVDTWEIALGHDPRTLPPLPAKNSSALQLRCKDESFVICGDSFNLTVDASTGSIQATVGQKQVALTAGPELLILALNPDNGGSIQMPGKEQNIALDSDPCRGWQANSVTAHEISGGVEVLIAGGYAEAQGIFMLKVSASGAIMVHYRFTLTDGLELDPRQIGLVFGLPKECQTLTWRRQAPWSAYPADHIGRPSGSANATIENQPWSGLTGPRIFPERSWSHDGSPHGTTDFRSTKMNIFEATLLSGDGHGVRVLSDGTQHTRSWLVGENVRLLVADYANEGAESYFSERVIPRQPLKGGAIIEGTIRLELH